MADIPEILKFFKKEIGTRKVVEDSDIENDLCCYGTDFHKLTEKYSKYFEVVMTTYFWSFHTGEEGFESIGRLFQTAE